jgi:pyruvate formate lyase activating enzyme
MKGIIILLDFARAGLVGTMGRMITGMIFDIRKYSIHDGPGIRTAVFFKGCPLECQWCHNPEGRSHRPELILHPARCILCDECVRICPNQAITRCGNSIQVDRKKCTVSGDCATACYADALQVAGQEMTVRQVISQIESDVVFFEQSGGGVTFTGGEPLAQSSFLKELLFACRTLGIPTAVDTSGYSNWRVFEEISPLVDLFLYDLKLLDDNRHRKWTGVSNKLILANLQEFSARGQNIIIRIPLIPGINDDLENLRQTGEYLTGLPIIPQVELLAYHHFGATKYAGLGIQYELSGNPQPTLEHMQDHIALMKGYGLQVK